MRRLRVPQFAGPYTTRSIGSATLSASTCARMGGGTDLGPSGCIGGGLQPFLQKTRDGALDTGLGLHGVDVAAEQERDDARR
jgi:hypothetical protein